MSGGWPIGQDALPPVDVGAVTSTSSPTLLTAPGANTGVKGAYTQLVASAPVDASWVLFTAQLTDTGTTPSAAVDFAIGSANNEQIIFPNLILSSNNATGFGQLAQVLLPIAIPFGARLSARYGRNNTCNVSAMMHLFDAGFIQMEGCAGVDALGVLSGPVATSTGTTGINRKTNWVTLTGTTTNDYIGFAAALTGFGGGAAYSSLVDIGVGSVGNEQPILQNLSFQQWVSTDIATQPAITPFIPVGIPVGSRVAIRAASSVVSVGVGVAVYGVYQ